MDWLGSTLIGVEKRSSIEVRWSWVELWGVREDVHNLPSPVCSSLRCVGGQLKGDEVMSPP